MSQNLVDAIIQGALFSTAALLASIAAFRVALAASRKEISKDKSADANCDTFDKLLREQHSELKQLVETHFRAEAARDAGTGVQLKDIRDLLGAIRDFTARQSAETQRWKDGYDFRILKSFLLRVISVIDEIEEQIWLLKKRNAAPETIAELEFMHAKLIGDLDGEGLVRNEPPVGEKIDPTSTKFVIKGVDETADATLANVISRSLGAEYVLWLADGHERIIRSGQVKVFKLRQP
jgi:molecular chaperone GrpE (heat shock protein)